MLLRDHQLSVLKLFLRLWAAKGTSNWAMQYLDSSFRGIGHLVAEKCSGVRQNCRLQRENLAVQRIALRLRSDWHNLPSRVKRQFFSQLVIDRAVWKLIESGDSCFDSERELNTPPAEG